MNEGPSTNSVVHVVDDDDSFRVAVGRLLRAAGYEVMAYSSAGDFLIGHSADKQGCLLLDVQMPGPSGMDLQDALAKRGIEPPIIFLTGHGDIPTSVRAMKAGAVNFLTKPVKRETLLSAVHEAVERDRQQRSNRSQRREWTTRLELLTPREREVLKHVVAGKLNKQIAAELGTAERTVKAHRSQMMEKMKVTSVAELVRLMEHLPSSDATASVN